MVVTQPIRGLFALLAFLLSLFFVLNYQTEDKQVFYLSLYIHVAVAIGTGIGLVLEYVQRLLKSVPDRRSDLLYVLPVLFFATLIIQPTAAIRWRALQAGVADFVTEDYPFPVTHLNEPRFVAEMRLAQAVWTPDRPAEWPEALVARLEETLARIETPTPAQLDEWLTAAYLLYLHYMDRGLRGGAKGVLRRVALLRQIGGEREVVLRLKQNAECRPLPLKRIQANDRHVGNDLRTEQLRQRRFLKT